MKKQSKRNAKKSEASSVKAKATSEQRDKETIELFSEILDNSCPRE